jgi:hypothetical protein
MEGELDRLIREFAQTPATTPVGKVIRPEAVEPTSAD